jgi:L-iditol 2-dehydrogenase
VALARRLGADAGGPADVSAPAARELSGGRGADQVIVTGGGAEVLPWAAEVLRDGGAIHCFVGGDGTIPLALERLYRRELTITATYSSSPADLAEAFRLIAGSAIEVEPLVTHRVPLESLSSGVDLIRRRQALKVYVTP